MDFYIGVRFPTWKRIFALRSIVQTGIGVHRASYPVSRETFLPGKGVTAECEGDFSTPLTTKVKKEWSLATNLQYVSIT
jgi:hypothetical protein